MSEVRGRAWLVPVGVYCVTYGLANVALYRALGTESGLPESELAFAKAVIILSAAVAIPGTLAVASVCVVLIRRTLAFFNAPMETKEVARAVADGFWGLTLHPAVVLAWLFVSPEQAVRGLGVSPVEEGAVWGRVLGMGSLGVGVAILACSLKARGCAWVDALLASAGSVAVIWTVMSGVRWVFGVLSP